MVPPNTSQHQLLIHDFDPTPLEGSHAPLKRELAENRPLIPEYDPLWAIVDHMHARTDFGNGIDPALEVVEPCPTQLTTIINCEVLWGRRTEAEDTLLTAPDPDPLTADWKQILTSPGRSCA